MAILRGYLCDCGERFEHMPAPDDPMPRCPRCTRAASDADEVLGGRVLGVIIPMHNHSKRQKAGFVHTHGDRPAERGSVAVPSKGGSI